MTLLYEQLKKMIKDADKIFIYGAGVVAYGAYEAISMLCGKKPESFLVSNAEQNNTFLAGVEIKQMRQGLIEDLENSFILVATPEEYHGQIENTLQQFGCRKYAFLTSHLEYCLMGEYLKKSIGLSCIEDIALQDVGKPSMTDARIYMAVSHNDKELVKTYDEAVFVKKIQVGAALADTLLAGVEVFDNAGDNISAENPIYGELTATYHAWKNDLHDIMGLFHYRRVLKVTEEQLRVLGEADGADIILPLPFVCYPDASGQYGRYLCAEDVDIMLGVLRASHPGLYDKALEVLRDRYLYNYNILIAKREVFEDYCAWLFPLLGEITKRCEAVERDRLPRYIGRIGEVLTSVYFLVNEKKWRLVHAEKVWRV